jgi:hypothetical protein
MFEIYLNQNLFNGFKFNCDVLQYVFSNFLYHLMHNYKNYNKRVFRQYVFGYEFACVALFQIFFDKVDTCNLFGPYKLVHSVISTNNNVKLQNLFGSFIVALGNMCVQICYNIACIMAEGTMKWFFASMCSDMILHVLLCSRNFRTKGTSVTLV